MCCWTRHQITMPYHMQSKDVNPALLITEMSRMPVHIPTVEQAFIGLLLLTYRDL